MGIKKRPHFYPEVFKKWTNTELVEEERKFVWRKHYVLKMYIETRQKAGYEEKQMQ